MNTPDRIWVTHEDFATSWAGSFRAFRACDLDHGDEYPEYIRADLVQSLIQAAQDLDIQFCDNNLGPSALAMGKLREAYMQLK